MSNVDQVVNVAITATSATPSLPGTEIIALVGYHTVYTDLIRTYFEASDMIADGFSAGHPLVLAATALCAQNPRPAQFKVVRGTSAIAQVMHFKVTDTQVGHNVGLSLLKPNGVIVDIKHVNTVGQTAAQIATALAAIVVAGVTIVVDGGDNTKINITVGTAGDIWYPSGVFGGEFSDTTATASPGTDLTNAAQVDANFYGVAGTWIDPTNIQAIAVWVEANERLHSYTTADTDNINTNNAGIFQTLKTAAYNRSAGWYSGTPSTFLGVAIMSQRFTSDPGSDTWAYKTVAGVPIDSLTPTQINNAGQFVDPPTKNGNVYIDIASTNNTVDGRCASGLYADVQRGIDALKRDMQVGVFTIQRTLPKVPYTNKGIAAIGAEMDASLQRFVRFGFLSDEEGDQPQVKMPKRKDIAAATRAKRKLPGAKFSATTTGAIQNVTIQGTLNF